MTSAEGSITSQASDISDLQSGLSDAQGGVSGNASAISGLDTRVSSAEGTITSQAGRIDGLEATLNTPGTGVLARISTVEGAYVDASGAVSAVEQEISASYGDLSALASATAFAKAQVDGISAGYVLNLNGSNVFEVVSVADGTSGPGSTFKIGADYVQITGLTQIDQAVINNIAVDLGFISNLQVDTLNLAGNAVILPQYHNTSDVITATSETEWVSVISSQIDRAGYATRVEFGGQLDGDEPAVQYGFGAVAEFEVRRNGTVIATNLYHSSGYLGARNSFSFKILDSHTGTGQTTYEVFMRRRIELQNDKIPRTISPYIDLLQFKR